MTEISSTTPGSNAMDISSPSVIASQDPASSLRAAALLTLKSKRRKPLNDQIPATLPRPPPPGDSFQLDYGQDDTPSEPVSTPQQASSSSVSSNKPTGVDVDQSREEGEISDEEEVSAPPVRLTPQMPVPTGPRPKSLMHNRKKLSTPPRLAKPRFPSPPLATPLIDRISESQPKAGPSRELLLRDFLPPDSPLLLIDQDHVRPGLSMRQGEYDIAKDVVLDLLGWGVPPEYLVHCGLSRQIVYYVFNELNLRLPQNLDVTGLLPYNPNLLVVEPPSKASSVLATSEPENASEQLTTPPPAAAQAQPPRVATPQYEAMDTHPIPDTPGLSNSSDLHDMERQRRQELLARKAVQASRKSKQAGKTPMKATPSAELPPDNQDTTLESVPTEAVDDFLKSIGSEIEPPSEIVPPTGARLHVSEGPMDIDEIPGLSVSRVSRSSSSNTPQLPIETLATLLPPDLSPMSPEPPPTSNESAVTSFSKMKIDIDEARVVSLSSMLPRRGTKRPVASDFVDFEADVSNSNGHGFAGLYDADELDRRQMGRSHFSVRKFVIDLSDSDSEMDDENVKPKTTRNVRPRRHPPRANTSNGWNTPISAVPMNTMSPAASPAALEEKEMEIRRMKEMIAQRESNRLKKLSSMTKLASVTNTSFIPNPIKQEEGETDEARPSILLGPESDVFNVGNEILGNGLHSTTPEPYETSIVATSSSTSSVITPFTDNDIFVPSQSPDYDSGKYNSVLSDGRLGQAVVDAFAEGVDQQAQQPETVVESVDVDQELSSSAQVLEPLATSAHPKQEESLSQSPSSPTIIHDENLFTNYNSLLERYPLLSSHSHILFSGTSTSRMSVESRSSYASHISTSSRSSVLSSVPTHTLSSLSHISSSSSSSSIPIPNLKPLRLATASKLLDPLKQVCRYEVPGGGVCRDEGCEDVHLSRIFGFRGASGTGAEPSDEDTAEYLFNALPEPWRIVHDISTSKILLALQQLSDLKKPLEERAAQAIAALGPPPTPT